MKKKPTKKGSPKVKKDDPQELKSAVPLSELGKKVNFSTPRMVKNSEADTWQKRVLIFTPSRGLVRMEWVQARYAQIIPTNWSFVEYQQFLSPFVPVAYQLADAQNLMAKIVVEEDYEWIIFAEDDNILPPDGFLRFNQYINEQKVPVVSGLYFLKSDITEPLIYRGRGTSHFKDFKLGDLVWSDGICFGFRLEHGSLIKALWKESEEYVVNGIKTRRVFQQPNSVWFDEEKGGVVSKGGTTDLKYCSDLMDKKIFEKAGWPEFQKLKFPFLTDTRIFVKHISQDGQIWPKAIPAHFISDDPKYKGKNIKD